jgi:hypothetical protein
MYGVPYEGVLSLAIAHARYAVLHPDAVWRGGPSDGSIQAAIYSIVAAELARHEPAARLRTAVAAACDMLAERTRGSAARSPGHNARLLLERALEQYDAREK